MLDFFQNESHTMAGQYSLTDVLERLYQNQLALEAAVMEMTLWAEQQNALELGKSAQIAEQGVDWLHRVFRLLFSSESPRYTEDLFGV